MKRDLSIANVHLDLGAGRRGVDMGPSAIHLAGLKAEVESLGHRVVEYIQIGAPSFEMADPGDPRARYATEIAAACATLRDRIALALGAGRLPVTLGGDHSVTIGSIAGQAAHWKEPLGVLWVDAHGDMNVPETSPSGNVHGMALSVLLGEGPAPLLALLDGRAVLDPAKVVLLGVRDLDRLERHRIRASGIRVYTMSEVDERGIADCVREALARVTDRTAGVHLSFDLDAVDPEHAPGVGTPVPGGLDLRESHYICEKVAETGRLVGLDLVELNPVLDTANQTGRLAVWLALSALGKTIL